MYLVRAGPSLDAVLRGEGYIGSAVAVSADAALTNCHVVQRQVFIGLFDENGRHKHVAKVSRADEATDRCFLSAQGSLTPIGGVRAIASLSVGERVYTIGNPSGLTKTLGEGLISGLRHHQGISFVQTNAPISPGSSGGALVDAKGALVGITTLFIKGAQNLNFAISAEEYWR